MTAPTRSSPPTCEIIVDVNYKNSSFIEELRCQFQGAFSFSNFNGVMDFRIGSSIFVLYLEKKDYHACSPPQVSFRQRLVKVYNAWRKQCSETASSKTLSRSKPCCVVICERHSNMSHDATDLNTSVFLAVQKCCVVDLGIPLMPVVSPMQLPQLLFQLSKNINKLNNEFKLGRPIIQSSSGVSKNSHSFETILARSIPGIGLKTASLIANKYKSLTALSNASSEDLSEDIKDEKLADTIHQFFNTSHI